MTDQPDPVDAAIAAAAEPQPIPIDMAQVQIGLVTGRPMMVALPKDITDLELLSAINGILQLGDQLRALRPASRLVMPSGPPFVW